MKVEVGAYAWFEKEDLSEFQMAALRKEMTIIPSKAEGYGEDDDPPKPIFMYRETASRFGIAREYFIERRQNRHQIDFRTTKGSDDFLPVAFNTDDYTLRIEQKQALDAVQQQFEAGRHGGIVRAVPGWGKTVLGCAVIAALNVPTLVVVHKDFLMEQWRKRILGDPVEDLPPLLPGASVGLVQQDVCDFRGHSIVLAMVHSLAAREYEKALYEWPGLVMVDECHRMGAYTWAPVPAKFPARYRLGLSATPKRKDGADAVFYYHLGPIMFAAKEKRLLPKIKRVWTKFKLIKTERFNPNLAKKGTVLRFLCASVFRNRLIVETMIEALRADRKLIVLSERLNHLDRLNQLLREQWPEQYGSVPSVGYYVGGRKKEQLAEASKARVIFATWQFASEGLDIPALDTLFMATPMSDVEQAVGRILRPFEGKKDPIVVDFRDDAIPLFKRMGKTRDRFYDKLG